MKREATQDAGEFVMNTEENIHSFEPQARRSLVVWVYSLKQLKNLKRFGVISYVSRKMKYIVIYMNEDEIEKNEEKINKLHFVRSVERSYRPDVEMNFADKIGTKAAYQEDDEGFDVEELNTEIRLAEEV